MLRYDNIYYKGNQIHSMDSWRPLQLKFQKESIKEVLEEEMSSRGNFSASTGIRVGESHRANVAFWLDEKVVLDEIKTTL